MTIHYHGTPITPQASLIMMAGRHFCISYARPDNLRTCLQIGQSIMFDNGAYSHWRKGIEQPVWEGYYEWLEPILGHPHWAVVPDVIDGWHEQNAALVNAWPFPKQHSGVVWHLNDSIGWLHALCDRGFSKICFGSTKEFPPGSDAWKRRLCTVFNELDKRGPLPWVHMMRGLGQLMPDGFPFASADSTNVAQNYERNGKSSEDMARFVDSVQAPHRWTGAPEQQDFWPGTSIKPLPRTDAESYAKIRKPPAGAEHFLAADHDPKARGVKDFDGRL